MRKLGVLVLVVMLLLAAWPGAIRASTDSEIYERIKYLQNKIDEFSVTGVYSDNEVYSIWVDLNQISDSGSVTTYTYRDGNQNPELNQFTTKPRSFDYAVDKITRYVLGNVANYYRQDPFNVEMTMITYQRTTIPIYVYGAYKSAAVDEIVYGLPNCFEIKYDTSRGRSDPVTPIEMPVAKKILEAMFAVNTATYTVNGETKEMDVAPEVKDNRTFVPVRYLAYSLGVAENNIKWDSKTQTASLAKDDTMIELTIGSNIQKINGQPQEMDVAPYLKDGRTMLPARWVAEPLGAKVEWDETTQQVKIEVTEQGQ